MAIANINDTLSRTLPCHFDGNLEGVSALCTEHRYASDTTFLSRDGKIGSAAPKCHRCVYRERGEDPSVCIVGSMTLLDCSALPRK